MPVQVIALSTNRRSNVRQQIVTTSASLKAADGLTINRMRSLGLLKISNFFDALKVSATIELGFEPHLHEIIHWTITN